MIIGIISLIIDLLYFNIFNYNQYNSIIFPMFLITSLISSLYLRKSSIPILLLSIMFTGLVFYPILFYLLDYLYIKKDIKNFNLKDYLIKLCISLLLFDLILFLLTNYQSIGIYTINLFVLKMFITIPINLLYGIIIFKIYLVLNKPVSNIN